MLKYIIAVILGFTAVQAFTRETASSSDSLGLDMLRQEIEELKAFKNHQELEALRREAVSNTRKQGNDSLDLSKIYSGGQTSQQALNPEISIIGDFFMKGRLASPPSSGDSRTGQFFRVAGLHLQSDLDPFSRTFFAMEFHPDEIELGEAFIDWNGLIPSLTVRAGKFLQNFGVINRWHMPSLDQFDNPLAATELLGGKINQTGLSLHWVMPPLWASGNELILEATNGQNPKLFSGDAFDVIPCGLARLLSYYDIGKSAYLNFGLSGMAGQNNKYHDEEGNNETRKATLVGGADLTLLYEPLSTAHHRSLLLRSEFYYVNRELQDNTTIDAWGFYSYLEGRLSRRLYAGTRLDYTQPFEAGNRGEYVWQLVPYFTFLQSPWVKLRLQYNYTDGSSMKKTAHAVFFQMIWSAGPHKHERY